MAPYGAAAGLVPQDDAAKQEVGMDDVRDRVAFVTGGASGIGLGIARALLGAGAKVAIADLRPDHLDEAKTALASYDNRLLGLELDVTDRAAMAEAAERTLQAFGRVDILVNNAGVTRDNLLMRMKDEEFEDVIRINLEAAFRLMRAAAKPMMKARFGRIISITSVVGVTGNPGQANYVASKAGLIGMTKSVAQELASRGITANAIAPGFMASAMTDALNEQQRESILSRIPLGAMGTGEDIGAACVYLASREAGYVTGQTLHVNGGMAMP